MEKIIRDRGKMATDLTREIKNGITLRKKIERSTTTRGEELIRAIRIELKSKTKSSGLSLIKEELEMTKKSL